MEAMALDTRQLRYFLTIAEQGSITRAAQVLNVAQPALSLHLKTLEERLGTPLMLRSRSGVTPTEAGALLMERARRILDELARTEDDIRTLNRAPEGVVRLGLPGTISALISLPLIHAVRARYPGVTVNIAEAMSGFVARWMEEDRVDMAVLYGAMEGAGFHSDVLLEEELVMLWPGGTARPDSVPLSVIRDEPMVLTSRGHGLRELIERSAAAQGFGPRVAMEIDSYAAIKSLVAEGIGATILPAHAARDDVARGTIHSSQIQPPGLWREAHLIQPTHRPVTRAQAAVAEVLQEVVEDLMARGEWSGARRV
jgi:LysR family nitrogen assimilation transcriptional regulator